jgi:hypothetical protein
MHAAYSNNFQTTAIHVRRRNGLARPSGARVRRRGIPRWRGRGIAKDAADLVVGDACGSGQCGEAVLNPRFRRTAISRA